MRRKQILEELQAKGGVRLTELSETFLVSEMTVRRDLDALEHEGLIERVHGGAVLAQRGTEEPGFEKKALREQPEKSAIAAHAAQLVKPGSAVALSAGTTTWALARQLSRVDQITVVTNSMNVWHEAPARGADGDDGDTHRRRVPHAVRRPRGPDRGRRHPLALLRPAVPRSARDGPRGRGLTTPNISEAETNRAFISRCRKLVVVADHTKWRTTALCTMAELSEVDVLVTDDALPADARRLLESQVRELVIANRGEV